MNACPNCGGSEFYEQSGGHLTCVSEKNCAWTGWPSELVDDSFRAQIKRAMNVDLSNLSAMQESGKEDGVAGSDNAS